MKNIFKILVILIFTISCKAQTTIITLDDPNSYPNATLPRYRKDINNVRDNYYGTWQGTSGNSELTIYFYKIDDVPHGMLGSQGLQFQDALFGYYIYKENGIELINSRTEAQTYINGNTNHRYLAPFLAYTFDGIKAGSINFTDYNKMNQNTDGSFSTTDGQVDFEIINIGNAPLEMTFELRNKLDAGYRIFDGDSPNIIIQPYDYTFSIPTSFTLTKIANVPPPL